MAAISLSQEFASPVAAARLFKALILDSHNLIPKLMPQAIKSIEIIHGDGGEGSIKQINFAEGTRYKYMKNRIDILDVENLVCKYTLIEGDVLEDKIKSITYEVRFEASPNGGCTCKMMSEYQAAGDFEINEEEIRGGKERAMGMYKVVEAYLFESPGAYE
ncbi:PREDICTED: major allergen Pru ar 1-like [Prunus mume]|uniref:Major allergen Pru ar 1-like n=1 Tax=Prunus mume TaxID=102107 RepID=A0ABM0P6P5_PRUMU|nr:PREDICTED: major allergen Pru ar 1-like [Prunus mume]